MSAAQLDGTTWIEIVQVQRSDVARAPLADSVRHDSIGLRTLGKDWDWRLSFHRDSLGRLRLRQAVAGEPGEYETPVSIDGSGTLEVQLAVTADDPPTLWCRLGSAQRLVCIDTARRTIGSVFRRAR